jgi:hypothetical protein
MAPEMPPDLAGHLEDDELVRPGGEPALAAELADLGDDRQNRVSGGLVRQIVQFGPGDPQLPAAAARFGPRDAQQHLMQPGRGALPLGPAPAQRPNPLIRHRRLVSHPFRRRARRLHAHQATPRTG